MPDLAYGYEEALGYCVDPTAVRDKDGVSAALLVAEMASRAKAAGSLARRRPRRPGPQATACTRPTSCRSGSRTSRRIGDGDGPAAVPAADVARRPRGHRHRGPHRGRRRACRRRTACGTGSTAAPGSSCARPAPSRSSSATSRSSSRSRPRCWRRARAQPYGSRRSRPTWPPPRGSEPGRRWSGRRCARWPSGSRWCW